MKISFLTGRKISNLENKFFMEEHKYERVDVCLVPIGYQLFHSPPPRHLAYKRHVVWDKELLELREQDLSKFQMFLNS
jgi:hypothetical protein